MLFLCSIHVAVVAIVIGTATRLSHAPVPSVQKKSERHATTRRLRGTLPRYTPIERPFRSTSCMSAQT